VPDTVFLQFRKDRFDLIVTESLDSSAAIASHHFQSVTVGGKQSRNEIAFSVFQVDQNATFVIESFLCIWTLEEFVNATIVSDPDNGALSIFGFDHSLICTGILRSHQGYVELRSHEGIEKAFV
jgi:hypothetical protein